MSDPGAISAFPWAALECVSRAAARNWGRLRRKALARADDISAQLEPALGRWLGTPVRFEWCGLRSGLHESQDGTSLRFRVEPGPIELTVAMDPRFVIRLVARALNHRGALYDTRQPLEDELIGAAAAVLHHIMEDARLGIAAEFITEPLGIPDAACAHLDAIVRVDASAYRVGIDFAMNPLSGVSQSPPTDNWGRLGKLPISLPLVIGTSLVTRDVLAELAPGKAFMPGSGLWVDGAGLGRGVLVAPQSDCGVYVELETGGKIVLRETNATVDHDEPTQTAALSPLVPSIADALRDAPVVLRVELGSVSLPAQQWAGLRVGDIVETGKPIGSAVVLRVAGQALAEGELINIDGELGVRITRLLTEHA